MGKIASIPDVETDKDILEYRKNEIEYWRVIYRKIKGSTVDPGLKEFGPCTAFKIPGINILAYNRVLNGAGPPDDLDSSLDEIIGYYRVSSIPRFFLQLNNYMNTPHCRDILFKKGFIHYNDWTRLSRSTGLPVPESPGNLSVIPIGKTKAQLFAKTIVHSFDFPEILMPHFSATVGYKGYRHYLVYEGNNPIAGGALFVRNQYASMAIAGTLPEHRGKGAQGVLLRERILQARAEGCRWITVETSRETAEKKVASFRNMIRFGFNITYHRPNFIYYP